MIEFIVTPIFGGIIGFLIANAFQNNLRIGRLTQTVRDIVDRIRGMDRRFDHHEASVAEVRKRLGIVELHAWDARTRLERLVAEHQPVPAATRLRRARRIRPPRP